MSVRSLELPKAIREELGNGLTVRRAEPADLGPVLDLLSQMHDESPAGTPRDGVVATYREILDAPSRVLLVAVSGAAVVGTLDLLLVPNLTHDGQPWGAIENIVVDARHRERGIGTAMLGVAVGLAEKQGCYKVQLVSHRRRDAAHSVYDRAGFDAPVRGYRRYLRETGARDEL